MKSRNLFILSAVLILNVKCSIQDNSEPIVAHHQTPQKVATNFAFTEGPAADKEGNIYFTDQPNDKIYKWDWKTNSVHLFMEKTGRANGTFFDHQGNLITCSDENGEIWKISKEAKKEVLLSGYQSKRLNGPNDLWMDDEDGIYFTDPLYERDYWKDFKQEIPEERLYYRNKNGTVTAFDSYVQPNGIVGSNKLKKLYVSDLYGEKTYVYDIVGEGKLANRKVFCNMGSDGMTLDNKGNLYLTNKGVFVFSPQGKQILHIPIEEEWTGNVTFGGKKNRTLFITASQSVYTLPMNVSGIN